VGRGAERGGRPWRGFVVAYRVRVVDQRGAATVVARSADGERLTTVATLDKGRFGAESMERPAGGYRLWYEAPLPDGSHELRTELIAGGAH
jgi:hypothetical protein